MDARRLWRRIKRDYGPYLPLSPYLFVVLFPFYWMVITAFKRDRDLYNLESAPFWFKEAPTLDPSPGPPGVHAPIPSAETVA